MLSISFPMQPQIWRINTIASEQQAKFKLLNFSTPFTFAWFNKNKVSYEKSDHIHNT
jgi:hypothetical protein